MKNYIALVATMLLAVASVVAQSSLEGKVVDGESGEPILFGNVALYKNGVLITGTETDFDGNYSFSNIDPGTYDVEASYVGYNAQRQVGVVVLAGKAVRLDFELSAGVLLDEVEVVDYVEPLIEQDNTTTGGIVTAEEIQNLPTKDINALAATTAGISSIDGGDISVRGSRTNATDYYIDGVRVSGRLIPQSEIDQMQVITGGIEAQYGDVTGGVISITTKGPSNTFSGGLEVETSQFLDPYGYNLISGNLSGPIVRNDQGRSVLGFRVSGQWISRENDGIGALGWYRASEDVIRELEENPLRTSNGIFFNNAEFIESTDVSRDKAKPNDKSTNLDLTAKIDARLSDAIDLTFSGNFNTNTNYFPNGEAWALFNWRHNPVTSGQTYRGNFRFRHRLGGGSTYDPSAAGGSGQKKGSLIRNASYTLQFGYQKQFGETMLSVHEDRLFDYAHVGSFENIWVPAVGESQYSGGVPIGTPPFDVNVAHVGYTQQFVGWTPGTANPVRANYNMLQEDVTAMTQFNAYNSFWSQNHSNTWSGMHSNVGAVYNSYTKGENDRYTFIANSSFDLFPGSSDKGRHNIQFGILYEQRVLRNYAINPGGLWTIARLQQNAHIIGVDTNVVVGSFNDTIGGEIYTFEEFQNLINENSDNLFYKRIRDLTGQSVYEYVNVDEINPADLSLDMFSPQELNDQRVLGYYGFDYLGNKISDGTSFDDFFTDFDVEGRRQFTVAPWKPIYTAAYIQDKFTFKDIIFRLGVRVDRYDANTKVARDPYSLYPIMEAADFYDGDGIGEDRPPNVEDDWKIYVQSEGSTNVRAYRDGDQWYNAEGSPVNDGNVIFGGELVNPYYIEQDIAKRNTKGRDFDVDGSFEDYTPQVNVMPRLAFSFPISDEANFFAHYDILVQRPENTLLTALDYYYYENDFNQGINNNPNLKPWRTIDYEVGFKQKLTNSSAISLSAYYKEMRDMVQSRVFLYVPAPVNNYESFDNIDFGTVKGFSIAYDLRRTNNLQINASYQLQFADGTGSNSTSSRGLSQRGFIRTLFPLSFDERHTLDAVIDILANAGANIQLRAVSGRPYTATQQPQQFGGSGFVGSINGARLPGNFTVDLRLNKQFRLNGNAESDRRPLFLDVYLRVQNLFDTRNVIGVYSATGSPTDDGWLASPQGQAALNTLEQTGRDSEAFVMAYQYRLAQNGFYTLPRRVYLGAIFNF